MGRPLRIAYDGAVYHVTARGNDRRSIFSDDHDRTRYLTYLADTIRKHGIVIHCWCLMENHYHLIVETPQANIARAVQYLNSGYSAYYNARHRRVGHLFQGRYKAILVEKDAYLHELSRYIHRNPVRARIVERPEDYAWSSYGAFVGKRNPDPVLTTDFILGMFSKNTIRAKELYRRFVEERQKNEKARMGAMIRGGLVLGGDAFVGWVQDRFLCGRNADRDQPQVTRMRKQPDIATMVRLVKETVTEPKRQKKIAIYLAKKHTGLPLREIGSYFGELTISAVSQICRRMEEARRTDKETARLLRTLESLCNV